jgi:hypothetical protein
LKGLKIPSLNYQVSGWMLSLDSVLNSLKNLLILLDQGMILFLLSFIRRYFFLDVGNKSFNPPRKASHKIIVYDLGGIKAPS